MLLEGAIRSPLAAGGFGVVAIGRNEGLRLRRCLESVGAGQCAVIYVDSGSSDGSVDLARQFGARVVELDLSIPFTAARARNAGFALLERSATIEWVQFVDGDCELAPGWLGRGAAFLREHPQVAAVCGRLRERHPEASVYNRLCDDEWNTPVGEALHCGGNAMLRRVAFKGVGGFCENLIAGEEPELCVRLRRAGWKVWRIDAEMALHDAALMRFSQWWRRVRRGGHAFAEGAHLHGVSPERHWVRESRSAWFWGLTLPLGLLGATAMFPAAALGFLAYPVQVLQIARRMQGPASWRWSRAGFLVLGKFAEAIGQLEFHWRRLRGGRARLIEYK